MNNRPIHQRIQHLWWMLFLITCAVGWLGLHTGSLGLEWGLSYSDDIIQEIRIPRTWGAWLAGVLLGLSGAIAQGLFRNPLADPYLLGSASGAALGVATVLVLGATGASALPGLIDVSNWWALRLSLTSAAFLGAWLSVLFTLMLARGVHQTMRLILSGVVVGVVLGAITSLMMAMVPQALPSMQSFLLGSTASLNPSACVLMSLVLFFCCLISLLMSKVLDALGLGETTARSLGLPLKPMRMILIAVMSLATACAVAQVGLIAFVGLVAPHLVRSRVQVTHRHSLLLSAAMGGALLCAADVLARGLWAPQELPVGVLTAVLGGGYLLWRMQSMNGERSHS